MFNTNILQFSVNQNIFICVLYCIYEMFIIKASF